MQFLNQRKGEKLKAGVRLVMAREEKEKEDMTIGLIEEAIEVASEVGAKGQAAKERADISREKEDTNRELEDTNRETEDTNREEDTRRETEETNREEDTNREKENISRKLEAKEK
jgi:hypothetical protein